MAAKKLPAEYTYDLSEFTRVDPNLIHYEEAAAVETGMKEPRGIAVGPNDCLCVAGDKAFRIFSAEGKLHTIANTPTEPQAIAVDKKGKTYAAMKDQVIVFDIHEESVVVWQPMGEKAYLTSIAAGENDVFVADAGALAVLRYDAGGRLVNRITGRPALLSPPAASAGEGEPAPGAAADKADDEGFIVPSPYFDVALAGKDRLWIVNPGRRRVELYTFDGSLLAHWGKASFKIEGFCGCCNPIHIAVLPGGHLVTSEKGLARVKVYTPGGELASVVAPPAAFAEGTTGLDVAADSRGRIWVLDPVARKVRLFTRKQTAPALEPKA
jgi:hypothetical protein